MQNDKEHVAKVLSQLSSRDAQKILHDISHKDPRLAKDLEQMMFTLNDLLLLSDKDMQLIHKTFSPHDLLLAIKGADEAIQTKLLEGISAQKKKMLLEELSYMNGVTRKEVEAAQTRLTATVRQMIESGEISMDDEWVQ